MDEGSKAHKRAAKAPSASTGSLVTFTNLVVSLSIGAYLYHWFRSLFDDNFYSLIPMLREHLMKFDGVVDD